MRLLFIICEASVDDRIIEMLNYLHAPGYTRFSGASGNGQHGRREGTPVWPGLNTIIMSCVTEDLIPDLKREIEKLGDERGGRLAVRIFSVMADQEF